MEPGRCAKILYEVWERKPRRGSFLFLEQPELIFPDRDLDIDIIV